MTAAAPCTYREEFAAMGPAGQEEMRELHWLGLADWVKEEILIAMAERKLACPDCGEPEHAGLCLTAEDNPEGDLVYEFSALHKEAANVESGSVKAGKRLGMRPPCETCSPPPKEI